MAPLDDPRAQDTALCIEIARPEIAAAVVRIYSEKGHLYVIWNNQPEQDDRDFVAEMWALVAREAESNVDHFALRWLSGYGYKEMPGSF
ncbi:MAG: hypothetical protein AB7T58_03025 [Hyphomonadaceae bacterium]